MDCHPIRMPCAGFTLVLATPMLLSVLMVSGIPNNPDMMRGGGKADDDEDEDEEESLESPEESESLVDLSFTVSFDSESGKESCASTSSDSLIVVINVIQLISIEALYASS